MTTYKVLSIDAWGNEQDGYDWNAWYNAGTIELNSLDDDKAILQAMIDQGFLTPESLELGEIDDDQYNLVIQEKATGRPIFAIEYGSTI